MKPTALLILGVLNAAAAQAERSVAISADRIRNDVRSLSSDEFLGRGPGSGGRTSLEDDLARVAKTQHLRVTEEPSSEAGWYFRSDHFPFARRGVPSLAFRAGRDLVDGGTAAGQRLVSAYNANCYHQPCDEFDPRWTFAGTVQEATVAYLLGQGVANSAGWPTWNRGNEYEALRRKTDDERATRKGAEAPKVAK